jgi:NADH-quinone oxidoreductase subunit L
MDWFNENVIARATRALGTGLWKGGTRESSTARSSTVPGNWSVRISGVVRWIQSGYIYHYAFAMLLASSSSCRISSGLNGKRLSLEKNKKWVC